MNVVNHQIFGQNKNYGKLFLKTNSTSSDWKVKRIDLLHLEQYTIIDNVNSSVVKQGMLYNVDYSLSADLSQTSGDCSIYLDVDSMGSSAYLFSGWGTNSMLTFIDFDVLPILKTFLYYSTGTLSVSGNLLNLENFKSYTATYSGLDFSQTTKLKTFIIYGNVNFDIEVDISNNPNLYKYSTNNYSSKFSVSNHRFLHELKFPDIVSLGIDPNINTTYLPNLRVLTLTATNYQYYDFNQRDLSLVTYLGIKTASSIGFETLTSLKTLIIYDRTGTSLEIGLIPNLEKLTIKEAFEVSSFNLQNVSLKELTIEKCKEITVLDLTSLLSLTKFWFKYGQYSLTDIIIDNGLNSQITQFKRSYAFNTTNVKVDDPIAANNGDAPYLPTVWEEYITYNSWNFV